MANELIIKVENGNASLFTPYNPDFVSKIKRIGGAKWDGAKKCWTVSEAAIDSVRTIMTDVYGHDDQAVDETVSVRIKILEDIFACQSVVSFCGKVLSKAYGRDTGAKAGDDVFYIAGSPKSGGSMKNWCSVVAEGSEINVVNISKKIYEKYLESPSDCIEILSLTTNGIDEVALKDEREKLLKRIAEIDLLLTK